MRTNYNDSSSGRNGRYNNKKRHSGGGGRRQSGGGGRRRMNPSDPSSINVGSASSARNKYIDMAKEALANGDRVGAEYYFQHAEHYSKLLNVAMAARRERNEESGDGSYSSSSQNSSSGYSSGGSYSSSSQTTPRSYSSSDYTGNQPSDVR